MGHWSWDIASGSLTWSEEIFRIFGVDAQTFMVSVENFEKFIHPDDLAPFLAARDQMLAQESDTEIRHRIVRPDGELRTVVEKARVLRDSFGQPLCVMGTVQDVTERSKVSDMLELRTNELSERIRELNCLYGLSHLAETNGESLAVLMEKMVELLPSAWQHPQVVCARITLGGQTYQKADFCITPWRLQRPIWVGGAEVGQVDVFYLEAQPARDEGPFLRQEGRLLDSVAEQLGRAVERIQSRQTLQIKDAAISSAISAVAIADLNGLLTYINPAFLQLWGYADEGEVLGRRVTEFWTSEEQAQAVQEALPLKGSWIGELRGRRKDGTYLDVQLSAHLIKHEDGLPIGLMASFIDITERKQTEESLRKMNERFTLATRSASLGVWDWTILTNELVWDERMYELFGLDKAQPGLAYEFLMAGIHPEDLAFSTLRSAQALSGEREYDTEFRVVWPDGTIHVLKAAAQVIRDENGAPIRMIGIDQDITERKQSEESMRRLLEEKDLLMQELQHRTKNSLNLVASLLELEMTDLLDERTKAILINAQDRIRSISAIFEQLYQAGEIGQLNLGAYIQRLAHDLLKSYNSDFRPVNLEVQAEDIYLDLKRALPLGIMLNELVTNALKYAFPAGYAGAAQIVVSLEKRQETICLRVSDNGAGMKTTPHQPPSTGLGLRLVSLLTRQINGRFTIEGGEGTTVSIFC